MSNTTYAATAGAARQRLAQSLGTLQQDANCPPAIMEIVSGLARAMGPLFQLERGSPELALFGQARGVLQETLGRMQQVDQTYPGVADATAGIAQCLGMIFQSMKEAGLIAPAGAPQAPPPPQPAPFVQPAFQPPAPQAMAYQAPQPQFAPAQAPAAAQRAAPAAQPMGFNPAPAASAQAAQAAMNRPAPAPYAAPPKAAGAPPHGGAPAQGGSVPVGPNGLPRLEAELGVHSETNFYTDFLGDIHNHGGVFVATFQTLAIGLPCEIILTFPGNLIAEIRGAVRWKRDASGSMDAGGSSPGLGVEIQQAAPESWNLIERFIRKREPIMHEM